MTLHFENIDAHLTERRTGGDRGGVLGFNNLSNRLITNSIRNPITVEGTTFSEETNSVAKETKTSIHHVKSKGPYRCATSTMRSSPGVDCKTQHTAPAFEY